LIGNPYRGIKQGGAAGLAKGTVSGVAGTFFSPFIGALGFVAKTSEGIGENSKILNLGEDWCMSSLMPPPFAAWLTALFQHEKLSLNRGAVRLAVFLGV
jgi:hypothetical protein